MNFNNWIIISSTFGFLLIISATVFFLEKKEQKWQKMKVMKAGVVLMDDFFVHSLCYLIFFLSCSYLTKIFLIISEWKLVFSSSHVFFQIYNLFFLIWRHPIFFCPFRQLGLEFPFWTLERKYGFLNSCTL